MNAHCKLYTASRGLRYLNCFLPWFLTFAQYPCIRFRCASFPSSVPTSCLLLAWSFPGILSVLQVSSWWVTFLDVFVCDPHFFQIQFHLGELDPLGFLTQKVGRDPDGQSL